VFLVISACVLFLIISTCSYCYIQGKEVKRACLNELVDYVASKSGVLTDVVYLDLIEMVSMYMCLHNKDMALFCKR